MRFAISIPQFVADGSFDPAGFRAYLRRAEELGFESAWAQEHTFGSQPVLSALETMSYAAACTDGLRLGCAVFVSPTRSPVHLAKAVSSLDQLSRGRIEIGLGIGGDRGLAAFGVKPDERAARFVEGLRLMNACWTQAQVSFDGRFWKLDGVAMEPKPFQKPRPPIWIGGGHPNALRRAVKYGDGFYGAGSSTIPQFAERAAIVREELARQRRDPSTFRISKRVYIAVDDDRDRARRRIEAALEALYGTDRLAAVAVSGTPDDCVESLLAIGQAGAELIQFNPMFDDADQMERFAAEIIPRLG
jgi:probable F420-dependent oxidoreductase